ncbi:MAG TPA: AMP-binding protein [Streptosporangiaceae bacterium]|nr:AMP-binding protein [Streptosporangiaceae bacterium]
MLLRDRLDQWAEQRPYAPAMTFGEQSFNWAQWRERILALTGALRSSGVRPGDRLAVLDLNHLATVELTLAASSFGAAVAVLNFRSSPDQVRYVLEDSRPVMLFHGAQFTELAGTLVPRRVVIEDEYEKFLAGGTPVADELAKPDDACLVMYTSGTTGRPKGAQLTHRGITSHSVATNSVFAMSPGDGNLVAMPLFHVGGSCYALSGILAGAHTILLREATPAALFGAIARGAHHAFVVPAVIAGVLSAGEQAIAAFGGLRTIAYGASPMPLPMLRAALAAFPDSGLVQVYGMTELSGAVTMLTPAEHRDESHPERLASAGRAVPGVEVRVVDPVGLTDVPPGEVGEIWIRTAQVMAGYLHRPEATAEVLGSDGWLRTGDIGRVDADGYVYILDRLKDMIITGGENVYGPEVESVLSACPGVAECAVIGVPDEQWGEAVKAIVVAAPADALTAAEVIAFCRERLAHYQCPTSVEFVTDMPRNATGKVLKRALRDPYWAGRERAI